MKRFWKDADYPLQQAKMIEQRSKRGEEDCNRQNLEQQNETDRSCFTRARGERSEEENRASFRGVQQRQYAIVQPQEWNARGGHSEDEETDHQLEHDSPAQGLERH